MLSSLSAALRPPASSNTACHRLLCAISVWSLPLRDGDVLKFVCVGVTEREWGGGGGGATKGLVAIANKEITKMNINSIQAQVLYLRANPERFSLVSSHGSLLKKSDFWSYHHQIPERWSWSQIRAAQRLCKLERRRIVRWSWWMDYDICPANRVLKKKWVNESSEKVQTLSNCLHANWSSWLTGSRSMTGLDIVLTLDSTISAPYYISHV